VVFSVEARTVSGPGSDGLLPGAGAAPSLLMSRQSVPGARTVRDGGESLFLRNRPRSRLPGGNPSGRRDPRVCLGIGKPPKMPLVDVEPKRDGDLRYREAKLELLLMYKEK
jgi:hypothetical protein